MNLGEIITYAFHAIKRLKDGDLKAKGELVDLFRNNDFQCSGCEIQLVSLLDKPECIDDVLDIIDAYYLGGHHLGGWEVTYVGSLLTNSDPGVTSRVAKIISQTFEMGHYYGSLTMQLYEMKKAGVQIATDLWEKYVKH